MRTTSDLPSGSDSPHFSFDPHHLAPHSFSSTPLIDYTIFDTPVDISLGALPPRPTSSRALAQGRIPRPRNAFMLFRSAFHREKRLAKTIEKDHRHISRIIGLCWAELPEAEKDVWRQKAELEKQQHALAYPEYRFKPTPRSKPPLKRNVKRNSLKEIERCHKIARLLQDGKSGEELTHAVRHMEDSQPSTRPPEENTITSEREERKFRKHRAPDHFHPPILHERPQLPQLTSELSFAYHYTNDGHPPFRSPLLPPSDFPQASSKRPYSASASFFQLRTAASLEPPSTLLLQPATCTSNAMTTDHNLYFAQSYEHQEYIPHEFDPDSKLSQRSQGGQQPTFEWSAKTTATAQPFYQAVLKHELPVTSHYPQYTLVEARGTAHVAYTSDGQFLPSMNDQEGAYYREGAARTLTEHSMSALGVYETWSNSNSNVSASPVQSDSPIKAL
ncbi:hypothetical protein D9756_003981 [Leucocoprinus leucothites]|uniref:HMG box domain-containing protein n=1 Tax=Leucocoprinus leucothites TaxID=201217 RepID=A0A8H5G0U4_9AGAR|nr:hypothetical protein D9756_003981 [Leucoagaricus leucothites]